MGIVDGFARTLRGMINKYMATHNTTKYINVIDDLVENYNTSYHSGIKMIPAGVKNIDGKVFKLTTKQYNLALQEETVFNIGDNVRCIVNLKSFEKKSLPKWSKTVHKIISKKALMHTLDNNKYYKYYELQKVGDVQTSEKKLIYQQEKSW